MEENRKSTQDPKERFVIHIKKKIKKLDINFNS